jgi:hypothetical protein
MTWVIVVLVVVALIAAGAVLIEQRRSGALRARFGPEYDRVVDARGDRREAEADLRGRIKRRKAIEIRDLSPAARERYVGQWRAVQAGFVDEPRGAVVAAGELVDQVMAERGYEPVADDGVAVDHPHLAADYRVAGRTLESGDGAPIDDLRDAFIRLRGLFDALVINGSEAAVPARAR